MSEEIPLINWSDHRTDVPADPVLTVSERVARSETAEKAHESRTASTSGENRPTKRKGNSKVVPVAGPSRAHKVEKAKPAAKTEKLEIGESRDHGIPDTSASMVFNEGYTYVHAYLHIMFNTGLSPYDIGHNARQQETDRKKVLRTIQKVIFWYVAVLATWQSFTFAKSSILSFAHSRNFEDLSYAGLFLFTFMMQVGFTYFLSSRQDQINAMIHDWKIYDEFVAPNGQITDDRKNSFFYVTAYFIVSAAFSIAKTVLLPGVAEWTLGNMLFVNADILVNGLFYWKPSTNLTTLSETYNMSNNTPAAVAMGMTGMMTNICWNLQIDCLRDLIMLTAIVNKHHIQRFGLVIQNCVEFKNMNSSKQEKLEKDLKCWDAYRKAHEVNSATNSTFDHLLRVYHANGVMMFATFWSWVMEKDGDDIFLVFMAYNMIKILYTLFVSRKAAKENGSCRNWIRTLPSDTKSFCVRGEYVTCPGMLDELSQHPLGFGMGKFHINDDFIVMFLTLSNAYLGVLAKSS